MSLVSKASGVTLVCGDEILLGKRCELWNGEPIPLAGYWSIFGGSLEKKESTMSCAIREIKEETGLKIELSELIYIQDLLNESEDGSCTQFTVYFVDSKVKPDIKLNDEHTDFAWFNINEIENFPYKICQDMIDCVIKYRKRKLDLKRLYNI